jgi:hypothetical protein
LRTGYDISERNLSKTLRVDLIEHAAHRWIPVGELTGQRRRNPWRRPGFVRLPVGNETDDT